MSSAGDRSLADAERWRYVDAGLTRYSSGECVLWWHAAGWSPCGNARGSARTDSRRALTRLRRAVELSLVPWRTMVTLTYPAQWPDGAASKDHLRRFLRWFMDTRPLRSTWNRPTCAIWVLEYQARGAPHYHIISDCEYCPHQIIARSWRRATDGLASMSAGTRIEQIRADRTDLGAYLSKELQKSHQKQVVGWSGRVWGIVGQYRGAGVEAVTMPGMDRAVITAMAWWHPLGGEGGRRGQGWAWWGHVSSDVMMTTVGYLERWGYAHEHRIYPYEDPP